MATSEEKRLAILLSGFASLEIAFFLYFSSPRFPSNFLSRNSKC